MRKMKDSGVEWIGKIPEEWKISRIKYLFTNCKGLSITKENLIEDGLPVISYGQIHSKTNTGVNISDDLIRYVNYNYQKDNPQCQVFKNDFIFADTSEDIEGCGNCVYNRDLDILFAGYHSIILHSINNIDNIYFAYLFKTDRWRRQIREFSYGVKVYSITQNILMNAQLIIPSISEQKVIASYLDKKCSLIDTIITKEREVIKKLKEYRQSIITEAVTKGIDKNVKMKDSGVEWIGEIPESWNVIRIKYVMDNYDYLRKPIDASKRSQNGDELYDYYGASGVIDKIDEYIVTGENILIGEDGANLVLRNLPLIYIAKGKYWVNNHAHILHPSGKGNLHFFAHQMEIIDYSNYITGSAQPKLSQENLNNVILTVPPYSEQKIIADYLDKKCSELDKLVSEKEQVIDKLEEYKKSLIYECVTGKKEIINSE